MKAIYEGIVKALTSYVFLTYILPFLAPIFTIFLGYIQGLPWMYIFCGACISFFAIIHSIYVFYNWKNEVRIDGKVKFSHIRSFRGTNSDDKKLFLALGFQISNDAKFPMDYKVSKIRTEISNTTPINKEITDKIYSIPPMSAGWYNDCVICIQKPISDVHLSGFIEFEIAYGRNGDLKYSLSRKCTVILTLENGDRIIETVYQDS